MVSERILPEDPLAFIVRCVREKRLYWTYHVNMRLKGRSISRQMILEAMSTYEIIESYPEDKYLPSYLVHARLGDTTFHVLLAVDVLGKNTRVVTAYRPSPAQWGDDFKRRRTP